MSRPRVLFLCTANSARSQLAEALLRHLAGDRFDACSAGTHPSHVHPMSIRVLAEAGVSTEGLSSTSIEAALEGGPVQHAFAVCAAAAESCPVLVDAVGRVVPWPFDDPQTQGPEAEQLASFRATRDLIHARIQAWLADRTV